MSKSKQKSLDKIRLKNLSRMVESKNKRESFTNQIGVNKGDFVTCTNSFKVTMLPGGFTKGCKYEIIGIGYDTISILDDENKRYDPMDLSLYEFEKYFK